VNVGIAVVENDGAFLVGVRGEGGPLPGLSEFPGGKCRPDEDPVQCAVRECREETGLDVIAVRLLERRRHRYPHGAVDLHFWLCRPVHSRDISADCQGFRWIPGGELSRLNFPEANASVIRMIADDVET